MTSSIVSRRALLRGGLGAVGAVAAGGAFHAGVLAKPGGGGGGGKPGGGGGGATQSNLFVPAVVGTSSALVARRVTGNSVTDQPASFLGYSTGGAGGSMPGPTFVVDRGETLRANFTNGLDDESTVHWHGMVIPTGMDGQPHEAIAPGDQFTYEFTVDQRATLNWYHPHPHGHTAEQVALGLAGAVIIRDDEERSLGLPSGGYEVPLILRDADIDRDGTLLYKPRASGYLGKLPLVNGTRNAVLDVAPAIYRFRVLNGSNGRVMQLALDGALPMCLIGVEGGLLQVARHLTTIDYGMAERLDLLVDFRGRAGQAIGLRDVLSGWSLVTFNVRADLTPMGTTMTDLPADGAEVSSLGPFPLLDPTDGYEIDQVFSFDGMGRINGQAFDMHRIDTWIDHGAGEVWRFTTGGNGPHPVHIHGDYFQVVGGSGGRRAGVVSPTGLPGVFPWEEGLKDTVLLQDGETVDVAVKFSLAGYYLMHCHKLEHEDAGMMLNLQVIGDGYPRVDTRPMNLHRSVPSVGGTGT